MQHLWYFSHHALQASKSTQPFICHLYLKSVHKIPSNFWKENLPFKRTHSHAFGPQKTLNRYTCDKKKIVKRASILQNFLFYLDIVSQIKVSYIVLDFYLLIYLQETSLRRYHDVLLYLYNNPTNIFVIIYTVYEQILLM